MRVKYVSTKEFTNDFINSLRDDRKVAFQRRYRDVDVLLVGDEQVDEPDFEIPHPRLHERAFVRIPLADIAPDVEASMPPIDEDAGGTGEVRSTDLSLRLPA